MSTQIILKVLALRHLLRQRDHWTRRQLEEYQGRALHRLREHAYAHSPFYRRFHSGLTDCPLDHLPVLTKEMVMEHFDELVTDPTFRLTDVEAQGVIVPPVEVRRVQTIPRTVVGKAPLIKSYTPASEVLQEEP